jgi:hypothetical protein
MIKEKGTYQTAKTANIAFVIFQMIAAAGAVTFLALVPGAAQMLHPFLRQKKGNKADRYTMNRIYQAVWRSKKRGLIQQDADGKLSLTSAGEKMLVHYQLKHIQAKPPQRWDKKWRLVAFDVWESRRTARNYLRYALQNFGFVRLQESLWVYPYDCEEFITFLRTDLRLSSAIYYMLVERIDNDQWLRKHFHLPLG